MALWMESTNEATTMEEQADLDAIAALKISSALELKEEGNQFVKKGKKFYAEAVDCYTRAIRQKCLDAVDSAIIYSNRAHVNLLLGNYRRALEDATEAVALDSENVKAYFRGAKAALALELIPEAVSFCVGGLAKDPGNVELQKLKEKAEKISSDIAERQKQVSEAKSKAEDFISALTTRKVKMGRVMYKEHTGGTKPWMDSGKIIHWPVLFLYAEAMTSDFIQDFCEVDTFAIHLDTLFSKEALPLPWDQKFEYKRENIELYYKPNATSVISKNRILRYILEGTVASKEFEAEVNDGKDEPAPVKGWCRVQEHWTLNKVLSRSDYIVPGIPVFYVISSSTNFYNDFLNGGWCPP